MMENWTTEWFFVIGAVVALIALYVGRKKLNIGGGKPGDKLKRK